MSFKLSWPVMNGKCKAVITNNILTWIIGKFNGLQVKWSTQANVPAMYVGDIEILEQKESYEYLPILKQLQLSLALILLLHKQLNVGQLGIEVLVPKSLLEVGETNGSTVFLMLNNHMKTSWFLNLISVCFAIHWSLKVRIFDINCIISFWYLVSILSDNQDGSW